MNTFAKRIIELNKQVKKKTGSFLFDPNDFECPSCGMLLLCMIETSEITFDGISKHMTMSFDRYRRYFLNMRENNMIACGELVPSDYWHPSNGWMNLLLDIMVIKGELRRQGPEISN